MCSFPPSPHRNKTMKFRQGTKWCGSSSLSSCYLPLSYLSKTKRWSLLHFNGFFSVNLFCCYSVCVLYFLLFVYFNILFPQSSFFVLFWCYWEQDSYKEGNIRPGLFSWFLELRQPIKWEGFSFSFSAGFPRCCYVPASSLTSSAKLCVEASVNTFRCGNTNSLAKKMYI